MIIVNGTIELKHKTGGGIDPVTGYPVKPVETWSDPIDCQYYANNYNGLAVTNGEHYTDVTWIILIDAQQIESEQLRLINSEGSTVGEYSILRINDLDAVCEKEIFV